ncbi:MAG: DMT family transporter [Candidatus Accumulibacter phosphatis]|jgi:drug/metabolite transporter (DMT)-like permease|uniref:DMT family transporter n=1 Tax=Candidatus Accumulibacter contiguus TaxID=2954381 RepID=A0ABX1T8A6_9PROT|nr:DMT family transporter [Candidatus Accumulibacter contiguus]NMQ05902.1 DMT family transporter [Candidatus Accumulibacter contiguus]
MDSGKAPPRWLPFLILGVGLLAISFGAILARFAQGYGLPSLTIATLRLGLAALIITPIALWQSSRTLRTLSRGQILLTCGAGFFLALHFATWITSLEYTSVASSTALVTTNLLWVGIASFLLFGDRPSRLMLVGIVISLSGSGLIFWSDSRASAPGSNPLLGNLLAIVGSWCFSAYLLIGRRLRASLPLPAYVWLAYGSAAILLVLACQSSGTPLTGYSDAAYLVALGMALGPQLLGHTSYNWSLKHVSPTFIAVVTLGEPVGSAMLAWVFFGEAFALWQGVGFVMLLLGIYLAARGER